MQGCSYTLEAIPIDKEIVGYCSLRNSSKFTRLRNQSKKRRTVEPNSNLTSTPLDDAIKLFGKLIDKEAESPDFPSKNKGHLSTVGELGPPLSSNELPSMKHQSPKPKQDDCPSPPRELTAKQGKAEKTHMGAFTSSTPNLPNKSAVVLRSKLEKMFVPSVMKRSFDSKPASPSNNGSFNRSTIDKIRARRPRMTVDHLEDELVKNTSYISGDNRGMLTPRGIVKKENLRESLKEGQALKKNPAVSQARNSLATRFAPPPSIIKKDKSQKEKINLVSEHLALKKPQRARIDTGLKTTRDSVTDRDHGQSNNTTTISSFKIVGMSCLTIDWIEKFRLEVTKAQTSYDTLSSQLKTVSQRPHIDKKSKDCDTRIRR